ncbi:MAG: IS607 family transposase [Methanosarcina sp.]|uniref:IS607 family transposase n=1 Tax=Methanosarcina sp. TaxID=2213 RepID=UPI002619E88B|nr:IS607 family transposase [Methanosarcina sp.]MDD3247142.1 IS607 family transposase [Methanosarcina sp.]
MKAGDVLRVLHISRPTLYRYADNGYIKRLKLPSGKYNYDDESVYAFLNKDVKRKHVIYCRVSTAKQKIDLNNQVEFLKSWSFNSGIKIDAVYKDIASGISFEKRKEFFEMLDEILAFRVETVIVAYKDRLSRIGFELFSNLFAKFGTKIIVVSEAGNKKLDSEEIFEEIISLLHCYSIKHYSKRKNNKSLEIEVE